VEDDARIRRERLREETRLIEERVTWARQGLGEVASRLAEAFPGEEPEPSEAA
jgi:hypothetical protein